MEVEVKLKLPDSTSHQRLFNILSPHHLKTLVQENIFFDGANSELSRNLAALRLRFYDLDSHCVISLKAKPVISDGISCIQEEEEPLDPSIGRACVAEPWRLLLLDSAILKRVREVYGIGDSNVLVCLGGFKNVRAVYDWNGLKLELDETLYDFGTCYEIECESSEPERAKNLLEELLKSNEIQYSYSKTNKFAIFRSRKLPDELQGTTRLTKLTLAGERARISDPIDHHRTQLKKLSTVLKFKKYRKLCEIFLLIRLRKDANFQW